MHGPSCVAAVASMVHSVLSLTGLVVFASTQTVMDGVTAVALDWTLPTDGFAIQVTVSPGRASERMVPAVSRMVA